MELPVNGDVKYWGIPDVSNWLKENRMDVYIAGFQDTYVDGEHLLCRLNEDTLHQLHVHPTHISAILNAVQEYNTQNPENIYDVTDEEDSDFDPDDVEDEEEEEEEDDPDEGYEPPDSVNFLTPPGNSRPVVPNFRANPPPVTERPLEPDSDYEEPDCPPPPPRPHRAVPLAPKEDEPSPLRTTYKPNRSSPPTFQDHLSSLPDTRPPEPPSGNTWKRGQRPPAPLPEPGAPRGSGYRASPSLHASVVPAAPDLIDDNYELDMDPEPVRTPRPISYEQETYEEVSGPEPEPAPAPIKPHSRHPLPARPLLPAPSDDDDSGGSFPGRPAKHTGKAVRSRTGQYPLVTVPNEMNHHTAKPSTPPSQRLQVKKKMILSYTDHELNNQQLDHCEKPAPLPVNRLSPAILHKPLPKPVKPREEQSNHRTLPHIQSEPSFPAASESKEPVDVSTMSVKDRMKFLQQKASNPTGGNNLPITTQPKDLMGEMRKKQTERKNVRPSDPERDCRFDSDVTATSQPQPKVTPPKARAALPNLPTPPKQPSKPLPLGPKPTRQKEEVPAIPQTLRPNRRRGSIDSESSSRSADEDKGLYGFSWYESRMTRQESIQRLTEKKRYDGAFIIRKSDKMVDKPFTLDVFYDGNVFHIQLRFRGDETFAMGNFKSDEQHWPSVPHLVQYFKTSNLSLTKVLNRQTIKGSVMLRE